jgi:sensor histidine kinase YesM
MGKSNKRFIYMAAVGIVIFLLLHLLNNKPGGDPAFLWGLFTCIVITIIVWEGNLRLDCYLNQRYPWEQSVKKRILVHLLASTTYTITSIFISLKLFNAIICEYTQQEQEKFLTLSIIIGLMTAFIILSIEISVQFFTNWKKSLVEIEKHKAASTQAQLQNLKNQINPHFLFNNLSVLSSLVYIDQDKAVDFINQLSKVYRYILDNRNGELATVESEITFIESYIFLLQLRFDQNISFHIHVEETKKLGLIPPMALQITVENAIKHNEISSAKPLTIFIQTKDDILEIKNNLQKRTHVENSSNTGLQNIRDRYAYFSQRSMHIIESDTEFIVQLPILKQHESNHIGG